MDYLAAAQMLASVELPYKLGLSTILLHDAVEIAIRCWLRYEKFLAPGEVSAKKFHELVDMATGSFPHLSRSNLTVLQEMRNSLVHDVAAGPATDKEYQRLRTTALAVIAALMEQQELPSVDLLLPIALPEDASRTDARSPTDLAHSESALFLANGIKLLYQGRLKEAEEAAKLALQKDANNPGGHHLIGLINKKRKRNELAIDAFLSALKLPGGAKDAALHLDLADTQLAAGLVDQALANAGKALDLGVVGPERGRAFAILGDAAAEKGNFEAAKERYRLALQEDDTHQRHIVGMIKSLRHLHRYDEALQTATDAIDKMPKNTNYYIERARVRWERNGSGDRKSARQDLDLAVQLAPANTRTYMTYGRFGLDEGREILGRGRVIEAKARFRDAILALTEGGAKAPKNYRPTFRNALSIVHMELGDAENAVEQARLGTEENPAFVSNHIALARALIFSYDFQGATKAAQRGFDMSVSSPGKFWCKFLFLLAQILEGEAYDDWPKQLAELKELSQSVRFSEDAVDWGRMWDRVKLKLQSLPAASARRVDEMVRLTGLSSLAIAAS